MTNSQRATGLGLLLAACVVSGLVSDRQVQSLRQETASELLRLHARIALLEQTSPGRGR